MQKLSLKKIELTDIGGRLSWGLQLQETKAWSGVNVPVFLKYVSETFCSSCKWEICGKGELFHMLEGVGKIQEVAF